MAMWRCPHCGTPQTESARCWVCKRSSTSCGTCRHFRRAIAANLGYCGLDRLRQPLRGDELRGCWAARPDEAWPAPAVPVTRAAARDERPRLEFVPLDASAGSATRAGARTSVTARPDDLTALNRPAATTTDPPAGFWGDEL